MFASICHESLTDTGLAPKQNSNCVGDLNKGSTAPIPIWCPGFPRISGQEIKEFAQGDIWRLGWSPFQHPISWAFCHLWARTRIWRERDADRTELISLSRLIRSRGEGQAQNPASFLGPFSPKNKSCVLLGEVQQRLLCSGNNDQWHLKEKKSTPVFRAEENLGEKQLPRCKNTQASLWCGSCDENQRPLARSQHHCHPYRKSAFQVASL